MKHFVPVLLGGLLAVAAAPAQETDFHGFVDASYFADVTAASAEFGADQAELDVFHSASERTDLRADLEWVKEGEGFVAQIEQAYMQYECRFGAAFTFGRFNAPIGFEAVDPPDMFQFSHSLVYTYGLPVNLTGAMVARGMGGGIALAAYVVNGWDLNAETNRVPTWGGRASLERGLCCLGASAISGKERDPEGTGFTRTVLDADLACRPEGWILGGELNYGRIGISDDHQEWLGFMLMAHHDFLEWAGLTVRYGYFDDQDGYALGLVDGRAQVRQAFTVAPTFVLDDGFGALAEVRVDLSDQDAFLDDDDVPTDAAVSLAFEMTYTW